MMSRLRHVVVLLAVVLGLGATAAAAHSYKIGDIAIGHAWAPPTTDTEAAVYMPLLNQGAEADRLVGASSPVAAEVRFRKTKDGETEWLDAIDLPPGKPVSLAEWREHLWLVGLKRPLQAGDWFDLTLDFANAGTVDIRVLVEQSSGH